MHVDDQLQQAEAALTALTESIKANRDGVLKEMLRTVILFPHPSAKHPATGEPQWCLRLHYGGAIKPGLTPTDAVQAGLERAEALQYAWRGMYVQHKVEPAAAGAAVLGDGAAVQGDAAGAAQDGAAQPTGRGGRGGHGVKRHRQLGDDDVYDDDDDDYIP